MGNFARSIFDNAVLTNSIFGYSAFDNGVGGYGSLASNRNMFPSTYVSDSNYVRTSLVKRVVPTNASYSRPVWYFPGWGLNSSGEFSSLDSPSIKASIEYNGVVYPLTFSGSSTGTVTPGKMTASDPLNITFPPGATYNLITRTVGQSGTLNRLVGHGTRAEFGEGALNNTNTGIDYTDGVYGKGATAGSPTIVSGSITAVSVTAGGSNYASGPNVYAYELQANGSYAMKTIGFGNRTGDAITSITITSGSPPAGATWVNPTVVIGTAMSSTTQVYSACAMFAIPSSNVPSAVIVGDSIGIGFTSTDSVGDINRNFGSYEREINNSIGFINISTSGGSASYYNSYATIYPKTYDFLRGRATRVIIALGVNDLMSGATEATVNSTLNSLVSKHRSLFPGSAVGVSTITPVANSSDSWATLTNQSFSGTVASITPTWARFSDSSGATGRLFVNSYIRAGSTGADFYVDIASAYQDPTDNRKWRVDMGAPTGDGIHPTNSSMRHFAQISNLVENLQGGLLAFAGYYRADYYNTDYDSLINLSTLTGDGVLGVNLYTDRIKIYNGLAYFHGVVGNYLSTDSSSALNITGDIDLISRASFDNWTSAASAAFLVSKRLNATQISYSLSTSTTGFLQARFSSDGLSNSGELLTSSVAVPFANNAIGWVRVTRNATTGDVNFYTAPDTGDNTEPSVWTQLGATRSTSAYPIFVSTSALTVGQMPDGGSAPSTVRIYYSSVRNGINGPIVAKADLSNLPNYTYGWISSTGELWQTIVSTAYSASDMYKMGPAMLGSAGFYTNARIWGPVASLPGTSGNYFSTPDSAVTSITGDIEIIAKIAPTSWGAGFTRRIVSKYDAGTSNASYSFYINTSNGLSFQWSPDGTTSNTASSTVATGFVAGSTWWVKVTRNSTTGDVNFYTSPDGTTYSLLGTTVSGASGAMFDGTSPLEIGTANVGTANPFAGNIYYASIASSIGGSASTIFSPSSVSDMALSWTSSTGEVWTVNKTTTSDTNDPKLLQYGNVPYISLNGGSGNYVSTPDSAVTSITGDIEIIFKAAFPSWTVPSRMTVLAKNNTGGNQRSYQVYMESSTNTPVLQWSVDGAATAIATATSGVPFADNAIGWVKVTRNATTGDVNFYTSTDGTSYSALGSMVATAPATMFDSTAALEIGSFNSGNSNPTTGLIYYASVSNTIGGTPVAKFDASLSGQTGYTDTINSTVWTINRATSGKKAALVDRAFLLCGTDDYAQIAHHPLANFGSNDFTVSAAFRQWNTPVTNGRYLSKQTAGQGYSLNYSSGFRTTTTDAVPTVINSTVPETIGSSVLFSGIMGGGNLTSYNNTTAGTTVADTVASLDTTLNIRIGSQSGAVSGVQDFEFIGAALFRSALSTTNLTTLMKYLGVQ